MSHSLRGLVVATVVAVMAIKAGAAPRTYVGSTQNFSVTKSTVIPGGILNAGDYTIQVLDQLSDRMLVRVDDAIGKQHSLFLAVPHAAFQNASSSGPADWQGSAEGKTTLRGFAFSNGKSIEFVYPKAQAASIATKNAEKVIAIDPESEGKPELQKMSQDDMKIVTLWMLTLTTASPGSKTPALLAQRYQADAGAADTLLAQNTVPPGPKEGTPADTQSKGQVSQAPSATDTTNIRPIQMKAAARHVIKQLPHTASELPLIWLAGLFSLVLGMAAHLGRRWSAAL